MKFTADNFKPINLEEKSSNFKKKNEKLEINREKNKYQHQRNVERLKIARFTIKFSFYGGGVILLVYVFLKCICLLDEDSNFIFQTLFSAIFGIITLCIGFVAGSTID